MNAGHDHRTHSCSMVLVINGGDGGGEKGEREKEID